MEKQQEQKRREDAARGGRLRSVHRHLATPEEEHDWEEALVRGDYDYYHFGQDGEKDHGWACAYRAMQTQCSWFILNRHPKGEGKAVPSIRDIQQALVNVGDKPTSFVGSQEWIGSYEICLCFDVLFGVTCKILFVASGTEVESKGKQLLAHIRSQGTPVMIGSTTGGAYTLLGLRYDPKADKILELLLLDPHFAGEDAPEAVLREGMVGWRPPSIFSASMFYNFCMPQAHE